MGVDTMSSGNQNLGSVNYTVASEYLASDGGWKNVSPPTTGTAFTGRVEWFFPSPRKRPKPLNTTGASMTKRVSDYSTATYYTSAVTRRIGPKALIAALDYTISTSSQSASSGLSSLAQYRVNSPDLNLGVILGEGRETYALLASTATRLARAFNAVRRGNIRLAARELGAQISRRDYGRLRDTLKNGGAETAWLQFQFGWAPLVQDVHTAVTRDWNRLQQGAEVRGHAGVGKPLDVTDRNQFGASRTPSANATWRGEVSNSRLAQSQALGLLNPAQLAWNLLPFSFVVDWFVDINKLLGMMTSTAGIGGLSTSVLYESQTESIGKGVGMYRRDVFVYRVSGPFSMAAPTSQNLGSWHALTSAALLKQVFSR
jgi:hypothetical protein